MENFDPMDEEGDGADEGFNPAAFAQSPATAAPVAAAAPAVNPNAGRAMFQTPPPDAYWIPKPAPSAAPARDFHREALETLRPALNAIPHNQLNAASVSKALEMATKLEGALGFDADRKAGVPIMEALQKWGHKMYPNNPAALHAFGKAPSMPFVPTETNVGGQKLIQMSPNRYAFPPSGAGSFTPGIVDVEGTKMMHVSPNTYRPITAATDKNAVMQKRVQYENIKGQIKDRQAALKSPINFSKAKQDAIRAEIDALQKKAEAVYAGTNAPTTKRLVYKDGKLVPAE
jgi:hypothetical protein